MLSGIKKAPRISPRGSRLSLLIRRLHIQFRPISFQAIASDPVHSLHFGALSSRSLHLDLIPIHSYSWLSFYDQSQHVVTKLLQDMTFHSSQFNSGSRRTNQCRSRPRLSRHCRSPQKSSIQIPGTHHQSILLAAIPITTSRHQSNPLLILAVRLSECPSTDS